MELDYLKEIDGANLSLQLKLNVICLNFKVPVHDEDFKQSRVQKVFYQNLVNLAFCAFLNYLELFVTEIPAEVTIT